MDMVAPADNRHRKAPVLLLTGVFSGQNIRRIDTGWESRIYGSRRAVQKFFLPAFPRDGEVTSAASSPGASHGYTAAEKRHGSSICLLFFEMEKLHPQHRHRAGIPDIWQQKSVTEVLFAYFFFQEKVGYFPTQKRSNMRWVTSSRTVRPVSSPSAAMAPSASVSTASGVTPSSMAARAALMAVSARLTASA